MASIAIRGLAKRFGRTQAVDAVSFDVEGGTVTGFVGPNGAGKTTTLRCLLGLVNQDAGSAEINGRRYRDLDAPLRTVGAVLEGTSYYPGRNGRDHVRLAARAAVVAEDRVDEMLDRVDLTDAAKKRVKSYSLGMKQRLGIAMALVGDPDVLVLDEPANGLDPAGIKWIRDLMRDFAGGGRAVLVSSHVLAEVSAVADAVVIIDKGRVLKSGLLGDVVGDKTLEDVFFEVTTGGGDDRS